MNSADQAEAEEPLRRLGQFDERVLHDFPLINFPVGLVFFWIQWCFATGLQVVTLLCVHRLLQEIGQTFATNLAVSGRRGLTRLGGFEPLGEHSAPYPIHRAE